ncbi:MAG TPA: sodium:solute symporter family protein [Planctomycetes bacterium]|nr:sodium:solute symporter family protein [Planctomycetota bacterium]
MHLFIANLQIHELTHFSILDWIIVAIYLSISLVIGIYVTRYTTNMDAYIGAGRSVGPWLGVATMTGTEMGLITVMYMAQSGFTGGFAAFHMAIIAGGATLFVGLTGFIVKPLRAHRVLTIPEYYEKRFGRKVRIVGGIILSAAGILNMGLFLQVGAKFIVGATGLPIDGNALIIVMTVLLILVLIYTVLGGMISVIITDYTQFVVLSFGVIVTTVLAIYTIGLDSMYEAVKTGMGRKGFDPTDPSGPFGPAYVSYQIIAAGLIGCAVWPTAVSRALAMESPEAVKKQYVLSSVSFTIRFLIPMFWGVAAYTFITQIHPEQSSLFLGNNAMDDAALYAMPAFLGQLLPIGVLGIITAAMIAAFMSTHDSYLLCWSSVITQDVVAPLRQAPMSAAARIKLTRICIVLIGIFIWAWGLFYKGSDRIWDYMIITGAVYFTGALVLLAGGLYWKRASRVGAMLGLIFGASAILGLEPIRITLINLSCFILNVDATYWLEAITSSVVGLISIGLTLIVFILGSFIWPDAKHRQTTNPVNDIPESQQC